MNDMLPLFFGESNIDIFSKKKKSILWGIWYEMCINMLFMQYSNLWM